MYKLLGGDQRQYGPVAAEQVRQWIVERRLNGRSLAQAEGTTDWKPLSSFPEFAAALAAMAPQPLSVPGLSPVSQGTNGMAISSLVLGAVGLLCCQVFVFSILGLIFGVVALSQLRTNPGQEGRGMAIAGIVLSVAGLIVPFVLFALGLLGAVLDHFQ